jgi:Lecithin retinol acyltransferase
VNPRETLHGLSGSFRAGRLLWLAANTKTIYDRSEVIQRARSRVGERRYRLLTNNYEHFGEWCLNGQQRSYQVRVGPSCAGSSSQISCLSSIATDAKWNDKVLGPLNDYAVSPAPFVVSGMLNRKMLPPIGLGKTHNRPP